MNAYTIPQLREAALSESWRGGVGGREARRVVIPSLTKMKHSAGGSGGVGAKAQENKKERGKERRRENESEGALARWNQYREVEQSTIASEERRFSGASLILSLTHTRTQMRQHTHVRLFSVFAPAFS